MIKDFKVVQKGLDGTHETPFIRLRSQEGDKLLLYLESAGDLDGYEIGDELTVKIGPSGQTTLPETMATPGHDTT